MAPNGGAITMGGWLGGGGSLDGFWGNSDHGKVVGIGGPTGVGLGGGGAVGWSRT
jgi:hypothetical protein